MTAVAQTEPLNKPSGKFSPLGMLVTLVGGSLAGIAVGLLFYGVNWALPFSIPLVFPAIAGGLVGWAARRLGSRIGRCRNPFLAVCVAILVSTVAWGTGHVADYLDFRARTYNDILKEYPQAPAEKINFVIDAWLQEQTGQNGFIGFMLLKANSSAMEITHVTGGGAAIPALTLSGIGLMLYWLVELVITAGVAGYINYDYAKTPYCEQCHTWRKYKTPAVGTSVHLAETVEQLQQRNIPAALALLNKNPEGPITRLEVEFCPTCYDSQVAKLVVIRDTGPKTWVETTVWADKLAPQHIRHIIEAA